MEGSRILTDWLCASHVMGADGDRTLRTWQRASDLQTTTAQTLPWEPFLEEAAQGLGFKGRGEKMTRRVTKGMVGRDHFGVSGTPEGEEREEAGKGCIVSSLECFAGEPAP